MTRHRRGAFTGKAGAVGVGLAVLLLLVGWLAFRALQVRTNLLDARQSLVALADSSADLDPAQLQSAQRLAQRHVEAADDAASDPLWRLAAAVPAAGNSFEAVRAVTQSAQVLVDHVLPPLVAAYDEVRAGELLVDGRVDLALLRRVERRLVDADAASAEASRLAARAPRRFVPEAVRAPADELAGQVQRLSRGVSSARTALGLADPMLGAQRPRRYFVAVHNNAEARGTGGLVGAYAVISVEDGRIALDRVGTNQDFVTAPRPVVDLGPEYSELYDQYGGRTYWSAAVITPHWPSAAKVMAGLWEAQGGGRIDGVLGIDPVAMEDILAVTGPAQVSGRRIGADNVVDFVMRDEYAEFADLGGERKEVLSELAAGLYGQVVAGQYDELAMLRALARAGGSGHLQLYSDEPAEQRVLEPLGVAGALPGEPGAYLQVVMNNAAGNKVDYYLRRRVTYSRPAAGTGVIDVELTNTVDASAVPPIVVGRLDEPTQPVVPGQTRLILSVYAGVGQQFREVLVDGRPVAAHLTTEEGHAVAVFEVEVSPQAPTSVTAVVTDPGGPLLYKQQPLVVDDTLDLRVPRRPS